MPFYEYECPSCKHYSEVLQKISDPPIKTCPSCGKRGYKRLVSAPVFRLKGSGWYETDFKSDKENKRNLVGKETEAPVEKKVEAKPDTKTEGKAEAKPEAKADTKAESKAPAPKQGANKRNTTAQRKPTPARRPAAARKHK
jgi:putative FmdB family regulatory protein